MQHSMFSIYDTKAQAYLPPFILPNVQMAQRVFGDCVNSEDHQFSKHPEDYTLMQLGHWDDNTGDFDALPHGHQPLGIGLEYIDHKDNNGGQLELSGDSNGKVQSEQEVEPESPVLPGTTSHNSSE